jgi:glycosyltransferase involved in cell wall biosynthesis
MHILFLNPFHGGSHAAVAEGYARHSQHDVELLTLSIAGGWRWRMRGAAVTFARMMRERQRPGGKQTSRQADKTRSDMVSRSRFDLILATDMLDLATFLALTRDLTAGIPAALYFHENQLTYPLPAGRARDLAFPWINYTSALAADAIFFNSDFHRRAFLDALPGLTGRYHDHQELALIDTIAAKAQVLPPGIDLSRLDDDRRPYRHDISYSDDRRPYDISCPDDRPMIDHEDPRPETQSNLKSVTRSPLHPLTPSSPVILWNSRWEYDKGLEVFFDALGALDAGGVDFRLIVIGEHVDPRAPAFIAARERLAPRTLAWGYAPDTAAYRDLLRRADIVVSTAIQEFFGISVIEAMYCGCVPILPHHLSYPEILPPEHHAVCLYDGPAALVEKLSAAIRDLPALKARDFRSIAVPYDWKNLAPRYDAALERIVKRES